MSTSTSIIRLVLAGAVFAALPAPAFADHVLVEFRAADGTSLVAAGAARTAWGVRDDGAARQRVAARAAAIEAARQALVASLPPALAQDVRQSYRHFPLLRMDVSADDRAVLAAQPLVVAVYDDELRRPLMQSALAYLGADEWQGEGYVGAGTAVAILDTGVRYWNGFFGSGCPAEGTDPAGAADCRVKVFQGFAHLVFGAGTTDPDAVADAEGHGTNVGGIVGAMAPGTDLLSLTVFALYNDAAAGLVNQTAASDGDVAAAMDWVITNQDVYHIVSANMSLGSSPDAAAHGYCSGLLAGAYAAVFANARDAGILPVVATGNDFIKTAIGAPACVAPAVRVGAGYDDPAFGYGCGTGPVVPGAVLCFSDSSALVDFIAPGNDIDAGGLYGYSGTSMASPMVAGLTAVYQARYGTDAEWTFERMRVDAVPTLEDFADQPYIHRFIRMGDHDAVLTYDTGVLLASSYAGLAIPNAAEAGLEVSADVVCTSEECASDAVGRVYVDLNVEHEATGELAFELEAPDGTIVHHQMASDDELGAHNINSILGSQHLPGVFDALAGAPIAGTWKLRLYDSGGTATGTLHRAALLIDSARARVEAAIAAPSIARPAEPFDVALTFANRGNQTITAAPLTVELAAHADGTVVDSVPLEIELPLAPGETRDASVQLVGTVQGAYDVRVTTPGLTPSLAPGLVAEPAPVAITERTFASFGVDPATPRPAVDAQLLDWSVGMISAYAWDFGDGTTSTDASPLHAWRTSGTYDVTLTVTGPDGSSTAARSIVVRAVGEVGADGGPPGVPLATATGGGCGCRAAGAAPGGGAAALLALLAFALWRRRRGARVAMLRGVVAASAVLAIVALLGACGSSGSGTPDADGGIVGDVYTAGPWVSVLGPADPSQGDVDLWLRVGHERSLPCELTVDYRVGTGEWTTATLDDAAALHGAASAPGAGAPLHVRWLSTTDLPGDAEAVELRIAANDGALDSPPVVSAPFTLLNFFVTHPHAVLITEVSTAESSGVPGRARDDYVELHNTTSEELHLDGWKLETTSAVAGDPPDEIPRQDEFPLDGVVLPPDGRLALVEAGAEYTGGWPLPRQIAWTTSNYGSVALVATYDRGVDFVRWGGSPERPPTGTAWTDDAPLPVPQTLTVLQRADEATDADLASDFCVAPPSPDAVSAGCLPKLPQGSVLVTELDSQGTNDQVEVLNKSGAPVDLAGWTLLWDGGSLGSGQVPLASYVLADGARLGLRDNGAAGLVTGGIMQLGQNLNIDGLIPVAVGVKDPYGDVIDFLAAGGSTIRWTAWNDTHPTPSPAPGTTLSRKPGDPDTDSADDFCLTLPNIGAAPDACLEPLGIHLVMSEVKPGVGRGAASWVEIYNPGPDAVDLSQVYLSYTAAGTGAVGDLQLGGTLDPGALQVVTDRALTDVPSAFVLSGRMRIPTNSDGSVALRDRYGFGIDFVRWGAPPGVPLWPDTWSGLGVDLYPTSETAKSIERTNYDAVDTNRPDDWCWSSTPSPLAANNACE